MLKVITCKKPNQEVIDRRMELIELHGLVAGERQADGEALVVTKKGLTLRVVVSK